MSEVGYIYFIIALISVSQAVHSHVFTNTKPCNNKGIHVLIMTTMCVCVSVCLSVLICNFQINNSINTEGSG